MMLIIVQHASASADLPSDDNLKRAARVTIEHGANVANPDCEMTIRLVDEEEGAQLNQQFRNKTGATNVLAFPQRDAQLLGDLIICTPIAIKEANAQGKSTLAHFVHLTVHGTLHLLGFDHQVPVEADKMEALEITILNKLGYPNPYEA